MPAPTSSTNDPMEAMILEMTDGTDASAMVGMQAGALVVDMGWAGKWRISRQSARQVCTKIIELIDNDETTVKNGAD